MNQVKEISAKELSTVKLLAVAFGLLFVKPVYKYIEHPKFRLRTTLKTMFNKEYVVTVDRIYFDNGKKFNPHYGNQNFGK